MPRIARFCLLVACACAGAQVAFLAQAVLLAQDPPPASAARILLLPPRVVSGDRATLAVLDVNGRLTPGVKVQFTDGDQLTTDATGRALFVAPLTVGPLYASIVGRPGRVVSRVIAPADSASQGITVLAAPRYASLTDRFEINGTGFCGDADRNTVTVATQKALTLASSPKALVVLAPQHLDVGPAEISITCGRETSRPFNVTFVSLGLEADPSALAPGQQRPLRVRIQGTSARLTVEARNLAPDVAELTGGTPVKAVSTGGANNLAEFQLTGKARGNMLISMRLVPTMAAPQ